MAIFRAALIALLTVACQDEPAECRPTCNGYCGDDDGCGKPCACPAGFSCAADRTCRLRTDCADTCASSARLCGEVCDEFCGDCAADHRCAGGRCACAPTCDGSSCGDDGCGGTCPCPTGTACAASGACLPIAECGDTCVGLGAACGEVCAEACGSCGEGERCDDAWRCVCAPRCDGSHCGDDGCGGRCPPPCGSAARSPSCAECALRLEIARIEQRGAELVRVDLRVVYFPAPTEPRPRAIDLRLAANIPFSLVDARAGAALDAAGKALWMNPSTGRPWRVLPDGAVNLLVLPSTQADTRIGAGEIVSLAVLVSGVRTAAFALQRRDQIFAPGDADFALQRSDYGASAVAAAE